jgi:hypothetical protein
MPGSRCRPTRERRSIELVREQLQGLPPSEYEEVMTGSPQRPCRPPETDRPALHECAPASHRHYEETTKQSL